MTAGNPIIWAIFGIIILVALLFDLFLLKGSQPTAMRIRTALSWSIFWIVLALLFNFGLWVFLNKTTHSTFANLSALNFMTGYLIEKALSVDNLFVFLMIFSTFNIPPHLQRRVLLFGVFGAIIMRLIMIIVGVGLIQKFSWILYIFGLFLLVTGFKMFLSSAPKNAMSQSKILLFLKRHVRVTPSFEGEKFFVRQNKLLYATPLFLALILIEISDLIFATDSIPAIFAITQDPFIIVTSNIFAILGLRALYFLLAGMLERFHYLRYGLALILCLIGVKLLLNEHYHLSPVYTLIMITIILTGSVIASLFFPALKKDSHRA